MNEMLSGFKELFYQDGKRITREISHLLDKLDNDPVDLESITEIYRYVHMLKIDSTLYGFSDVSFLCRKLEILFDDIRKNQRVIEGQLISDTRQSCHFIDKYLNQNASMTGILRLDYRQIMENFNRYFHDHRKNGAAPEKERFRRIFHRKKCRSMIFAYR